jgi:hypothetical protein
MSESVMYIFYPMSSITLSKAFVFGSFQFAHKSVCNSFSTRIRKYSLYLCCNNLINRNLVIIARIMSRVNGKCGHICSECPWGIWSRKKLTPDDWNSFAEDVKKHLGYTPAKNPCHGCQTPNEELSKNVGVHNFLRGCSARSCAFYNEFQNCAYCSRYPCDKIEAMNLENDRTAVEARLGFTLPEEKYQAYVRVFEGKKSLDRIRANLKPSEILKAKVIESKLPNIVPFPSGKLGKKEIQFKELHEKLSEITSSTFGIRNNDVVSGQEMMETRREIALRTLWIAARYGSIQGGKLVVDSILINTHKKGTSGFPTTESAWKRWFSILRGIGINCEIEFADIDEDRRKSPIGWLRERIPGTEDPAWFLKMSFDESLESSSFLKVLKGYADALEEKFGNRAFGNFKKVDMRFVF